MEILRGNALIGQSGGPTAVINQSLVGVVERALAAEPIQKVYGALHGIQGILDGKIVDLGQESRETLELVAGTPGAALGSVRRKPNEEDCRRILEALKALDVRYFFYIGGNDSAETAFILNQQALKQDYAVRLFHVPKTIDNDLEEMDHCPGFASAAKYVAQAIMGDNLDNEALPGIKIDVIMGRNVGWLTAASILARRHPGDGPHLVYVPEHGAIDPEAFIRRVRACVEQHGRCLIAISEGMRARTGDYLVHALAGHYVKDLAQNFMKEQDSHGNVQLSGVGALGDLMVAYIKQELGEEMPKLRVRADTFGYPQRSFAGLVSEVDAREARDVGRHAVDVAVSGERPHGSIVILRKPGPQYASEYGVVDLEKLAQKTRVMPSSYLKGDDDIDDSYLEYVAPLVGPLPPQGTLKRVPVPGARAVSGA